MILQKLRDATRCEHERLEARIDLLNRSWSPVFYQLLLQKFYGFYGAIESHLYKHSEWSHLPIDPEQRRKIGLLRLDLAHLGLSESDIEALPHCERVPSLCRFAQVLGVAYVLEGSTLGGQIITRHLARELGISPERGGAFFYAYGPRTGPMWREFVAVLEAYQGSEAEQAEGVESARTTFTALEAWLSDIL